MEFELIDADFFFFNYVIICPDVVSGSDFISRSFAVSSHLRDLGVYSITIISIFPHPSILVLDIARSFAGFPRSAVTNPPLDTIKSVHGVCCDFILDSSLSVHQ